MKFAFIPDAARGYKYMVSGTAGRDFVDMESLSSLADLCRGHCLPAQRAAVSTPTAELSYAVIDHKIEQVREQYVRMGASVQDRVALVLPSSPGFICHYLGAQRAGLVVMPLNPLLGQTEIKYIMSTMEPDFVVMPARDHSSPASLAVLEHMENAEHQTQIVTVHDLDMLDGLGGGRNTVARRELTNDREALILFTSGTSGMPKGASHGGRSVLQNALQSNKLLDMTTKDVVVSPLPFAHTFGQSVIMLGSLAAGAEIAIPRSAAAEHVMSWMDKREATIVAGVPSTFAALVDIGKKDQPAARHAGRHLRMALAGGSPLPSAVSTEFEQLFGVPVHQGYGMTEVACCIALENPKVPPAGSVGKVFDSLDYRIIPTGSNKDEGELQLAGPNILRGYYTDGKFMPRLKNVWFETGDLVRRSDDGTITVFDRKKEMIIRNGYNIYPSEVEAALSEHPDVVMSAVIGIDDNKVGQEVAAYIELREGAAVSAGELSGWCRDKIALYKYPRLIGILPALPKNASGKILKRALNPDLLEDLRSASVQ